jgi:trimeric autotransporter adhesin
MVITDAAALEQNVPNPFTNTTTIGYYLPNKFSSAKMVITDKNGKQLKQLNITGAGKGTIYVNASSGAYNYSLYMDGRFIASKS